MKKIGILSTIALIAGCSSITIEDYKFEKPILKLESYLNGNLEAHGIFQDRSGKVIKRFKVLMKASWNNGIGTLDENFIYSDGTKSTRVWTIKNKGEGQYSGTASDVIGEAIGESSGNAFQWKYTLSLPVDGSTYHVQFDDWMYLMDENIMLNKSKMSKFGIYLGEVTLTFIKK